MTKLVHCKKEPYDIYIGRPSKWGNPFTMGKDGTREEVIEKYHGWILKQHDLLQDLEELRGKTLACWCSPKACHGDILIELLELRDILILPEEKDIRILFPPIPLKHESEDLCLDNSSADAQ